MHTNHITRISLLIAALIVIGVGFASVEVSHGLWFEKLFLRGTVSTGSWGENCSLTLGYWKNHTDEWYGYSTSQPFYNSGLSWLEALKQPTKTDAYYILARQFIAAVLNMRQGAALPGSVASTMNDAHLWFVSNGPGVPPDSSDGQVLVAWAELLTDFNEGRIGPGHCDDVLRAEDADIRVDKEAIELGLTDSYKLPLEEGSLLLEPLTGVPAEGQPTDEPLPPTEDVLPPTEEPPAEATPVPTEQVLPPTEEPPADDGSSDTP